MNSWKTELKSELLANRSNWYGADNWDSDRFGRFRESISDRIITYFNKYRLGKMLFSDDDKVEQLMKVKNRFIKSLTPLYDLLVDDYSKAMLVKVIAYRLLGFRKVMLPLNNSSYREQVKLARSMLASRNILKCKSHGWILEHYALERIEYPVEIFFRPAGIVVTFMIKQYEYSKIKPGIGAEHGDYVIDGGGCWGDSTLFFSHAVGPEGRVYTFEFEPDNLDVLQKNLDMNPSLSMRISVIPKALWNSSGQTLNYSPRGPSTSVAKNQQASQRVMTISIDDFVAEQGLPKVDFIKMDIEGSELKALKGAEGVLKRFKPSLAISLYHNEEDFLTIPEYLDGLELGYEFYLDHFTIHNEETILFARQKA